MLNNHPHYSKESHGLQAFLFGGFVLRKDSVNLPLPDATDARRLLAYLLLHKSKLHSRTALLGVFWPEMSETRARRALSQAIWHIRRRFPGLVETKTESVYISSGISVWSDVVAFKELTEAYFEKNYSEVFENLSEAVQLYQGELLEGFDMLISSQA